jgi:hypothetical protein
MGTRLLHFLKLLLAIVLGYVVIWLFAEMMSKFMGPIVKERNVLIFATAILMSTYLRNIIEAVITNFIKPYLYQCFNTKIDTVKSAGTNMAVELVESTLYIVVLHAISSRFYS